MAQAGEHVLVPRSVLRDVTALLWAYHNDDVTLDGCDGNCTIMRLVTTLRACDGQLPAVASAGTYRVSP